MYKMSINGITQTGMVSGYEQARSQKYQKKELKTNIYFLDVITLHVLSQKTSG